MTIHYATTPSGSSDPPSLSDGHSTDAQVDEDRRRGGTPEKDHLPYGVGHGRPAENDR